MQKYLYELPVIMLALCVNSRTKCFQMTKPSYLSICFIKYFVLK